MKMHTCLKAKQKLVGNPKTIQTKIIKSKIENAPKINEKSKTNRGSRISYFREWNSNQEDMADSKLAMEVVGKNCITLKRKRKGKKQSQQIIYIAFHFNMFNI